MRRRRAERCLLRADAALTAGVREDAEAALTEARRLDPSSPGLLELEQRFSHSPAAEEVVSRPRTVSRLLKVAAGGAVLLLGAALAWRSSGPEPNTIAAPAPVRGDMVLSVPRDVVSVRHTTVVPFIHASDLASANRTAVEATPAEPDPESAAPIASPPAVAVAPALQVTDLESNVPLGTPTPPPEMPIARNAEPPSPPVVPAMRSPEPAPAVSAASVPPPVDEGLRVRSVLQRYEAAYSGLNASAAHDVWPGVDQRALARAFEGLESQRLSLGRCDVTVEGSIARAECAGSATWTPKVGSGRTEQRQWAFDLRNASGLWQIVRAEVR
jgi:hypothetical protein